MNIQNISKNFNTIPCFMGKGNFEEKNTPQNEPNSDDVIVTINPSVILALQNVQPYAVLTNEEGEQYIKFKNLEIEPDFVSEFLTDKNGKIDSKMVVTFIRAYEAVLNKMNEDEKETMAMFEKDMLKETLKENKLLTDIMERMIENNKINPPSFEKPAYEKTKILFKLSKTPDGYDFSDMDKKNKLYSLISNMEYNTGIVNPDYILYLIKDDKGSYDIDFGIDFAEIYSNLQLSYSPKVVSETLREWFNRDIGNKNEIKDTVYFLQGSDFTWDDRKETNYIVNLMECLFDDDGNFDVEKKDDLISDILSINDEIEDEIDELGFKCYGSIVKFHFDRLMEKYRDY